MQLSTHIRYLLNVSIYYLFSQLPKRLPRVRLLLGDEDEHADAQRPNVPLLKENPAFLSQNLWSHVVDRAADGPLGRDALADGLAEPEVADFLSV